VGDATGASLVTTGFFTDTNSLGQIVAPESQVIAGLQQAVNDGVNVVSESYGYGALPGANDNLLEPTNDAMVQAGIVVVESAGDSGSSSYTERVFGTYRVLGSETSFGKPVTENVSAPSPSAPIPAQGATAAAPITFTVPRGVSVLDADMRWPDPTNSADNILTFILTDPAGRLAQSSYHYGASNGPNATPDIQHSTVEHPMPGTWTAQIVWANGRGQVQTAPDTPGPYTGTVTFQASGQNFTTSPASAPVTIPPRSSVSVPLSIALPQAPGDAPESVQFTARNGLESSVPIARRTLIPSAGGSFSATLTSSVSRGPGQIKTFYVEVPQGENDLDVSFYRPCRCFQC